ncbi:MAG: YceK/YidQ family lipoprotein [Gammaproteobacteria bacterium]
MTLTLSFLAGLRVTPWRSPYPVIDLPFSVVLDTLLLPATINAEI